jgi:hypothetical protein
MSYFHELIPTIAADVPELPTAIHDRAALLAIESIARYPLTFKGNVLVADSLMCQLYPLPRLTTGVGIREMGALEPRPDYCAFIINKIHNRFGIARVVTPEEAVHYVRMGGMLALELIRRGTMVYAADYQVSVPHEISEQPFYQARGAMAIFNGAAAQPLHRFLRADQHYRLQMDLATDILERAEVLRATSRDQQQAAQELGHFRESM